MSTLNNKKKWLFSSLSLQTVLTIAISCFSLVVAILALIVNYNSTHNAMRPLLFLGVGDSQNPTPCFGIFVRNNGMGPARINNIDISFDGQALLQSENISLSIAQAGFHGQPLDFEILSEQISKNSIIGAGQEVLLFAGNKKEISNINELEKILKRVQVHIQYSSVTKNSYDSWLPSQPN